MAKTPVLIIPGLSSSGPNHWQSLWEYQHPEFTRLHQQDWYDPRPENWVRNLENAIQSFTQPPVLVAHSLGCICVALWAAQHQKKQQKSPIKGAFLVAPADVDQPNPHSELLLAFQPLPLSKLPFPSCLIASQNDPYAHIERIRLFAQSWHSELIELGALGHINTQSNLADWPQGFQLFQQWCDRHQIHI